jgi:transposase
MARISVLGIDLAKNVFQIHGTDERGKAVLKHKLRRAQLPTYIANLEKCTIAMEACGGAHAWARKFRGMGHEAVLISPQYIKPFVKTNKSDKADAEAIAEVVVRPSIPHVAIKEPWHSEVQALHRIRSRHMKNRTALCNEIRGILAEFGISIPKGPAHVKHGVRAILDGKIECADISMNLRAAFEELTCELMEIEARVKTLELRIQETAGNSDECRRLMEIPGIGLLSATAIIAKMPSPMDFKNGRQFAAYLGLVPRHDGTGGKNRILGLSKRGDRYLRTLLVHGARSILRISSTRSDNTSLWAEQLKQRKGYNRASVALANKNARIAWRLMAKKEAYVPRLSCIAK